MIQLETRLSTTAAILRDVLVRPFATIQCRETEGEALVEKFLSIAVGPKRRGRSAELMTTSPTQSVVPFGFNPWSLLADVLADILLGDSCKSMRKLY